MPPVDFLFGLPNPARRRLLASAFLVLLVTAAFLRFDGLGEPSLWLDEILHVEQTRRAMAEMEGVSWMEWPSALSIDRENGALYYAGQAVALSVFGQDEARVEFAARWMPALAGVSTVAVLFFVVLRASRSSAVALVAMALLAVAPLHVDYSREGRPYSVVLLATTLLLLLGFQDRKRWVVPAIGLVAMSTACLGAVAAPVLVAFVPVATASYWLRKRALYRRWHWRRDLLLAIACGLALVLMAFLFPTVPGLSQVTGATVEAPDHGGDLSFVSPVSARSLGRLLSSLTTSGLDSSTAGWLSFALLAVGLWGAVRWTLEDTPSALWIVGLWLLPIAGWLVLLYRFEHWYNVRYTSAALPAFLALVAYGLVDGARGLSLVVARVARRLPSSALPAAFLGPVLLAILVPNWAASRTEPWQKPDWRGAAQLIAILSDGGETVIGRDDWASTCLRFYLQRHSSPSGGLEVQSVNFDLAAAEELARRHPRGWVAAAGYREGAWFEPLFRGLDPVLLIPRANLRLFRRPSFESIRWDSVTPDEGRILSEILTGFGETPHRQDFGRAEALLGTGWSVAEADPAGMTFRWAASRRAEIALVAPVSDQPRALKIRAMPFPGRGRPAQTVQVSVDGEPLVAVSLEPGWNELTLPSFPSGGPADHVVFEFGWTQSPREVDPASGDGRSLAVAFDFVEIVPAESVPAAAAKEGLDR
ncbi:MAG: hypothetical protein MPN21_17730 [Thermoanaerobaculia bacterium]|nr:hypothetical protein [Thermoanaerobaculia bacterium]